MDENICLKYDNIHGALRCNGNPIVPTYCRFKPYGSYLQTCRTCEVDSSCRMTCSCPVWKDGSSQWFRTSHSLNECQGHFINVDGHLHCLNPYLTVTSTEILSMNYPSLENLPFDSPPKSVGSKHICNESPHDFPTAEYVVTCEVQTADHHCFTFNTEKDIGASLQASVTTGVNIPFIAHVETTEEAGAHWDSQFEQGIENCRDETITTERTRTVPSLIMPAHSRITYRVSQWQAEVTNLPFTAQVRVHYSNGHMEVRSVSGVYTGTSHVDDIMESFTDAEENVTSCDGSLEFAVGPVTV